MKKLYAKSELGFAIAWIIAYCVLMSLGDNLSETVGVTKAVTLPVAAVLSLLLLIFIIRNGFKNKYGLCKPREKASKLLFYIPLLLLFAVNLWHGFNVTLSATEVVLYVLTMLCVAFLEEVIFRGLLFSAMAKGNFKAAVIVSGVTFGMGHIINLINGSGAELFENILQVIYATAAGFMLVAVFLKSKSLAPCIVFHGMFNALSVFGYGAEITPQKRIASCVFLVAVSTGYALYLALSGRRDGKKTDDNTACK